MISLSLSDPIIYMWWLSTKWILFSYIYETIWRSSLYNSFWSHGWVWSDHGSLNPVNLLNRRVFMMEHPLLNNWGRHHWPCNFSLWSSNNIIYPRSDYIYFVFSVQIHPHSVTCVHELFELFLEAVVLVIQVGHVLVECINFSLQVNLIFKHLVGMLLQSVDFVANRLFILNQFVECNFELGEF